MIKILVVNFFPAINPPTSGGEMRYYYLYKYLSKYFDITLLSTTSVEDKEQTITYSETFREYRVPRHKNYNSVYYSIYKEDVAPEISGLVSILNAKEPQRFHEVFLDLQQDKDLIIHSNPYMFFYDLTAYVDNKPRIYDAYNVESELVDKMWKGKNADKYKHFVQNAEKELINIASMCLASSKEDIEIFKKLYNIKDDKLKLVPNGIELLKYKNISRKPKQNKIKKAIFIGSLYPPNIRAAQFIIDNLSKDLKDIEFLIAGSCSTELNTKNLTENVKILGKISEEEKLTLLQDADVAINPMFDGGGSNLKMLEYMAASLPIISTPVGARGLDIKDEVLISSPENFSKDLIRLITDEELANEFSQKALEHVKKFSWESIADKAKDYIEEAISNYKPNRKKIMILNDFPVSEASLGGEVRINRLYSHLSEYYDVVLYCFSKDEKIHIRNITKNFKEISIPKTKEHLSNSSKFAYYISAEDVVSYMMASKNKLLKKIVKNAEPYFTILIHPYMASLIEDIDRKNLIYESLNAEFFLKKDLLKAHPNYSFLLEKVREAEELSIKKSKFVISVSKDDIDALKSLGAKDIYVVPNGTDINPSYIDEGTKKYIKSKIGNKIFAVFLGSGHIPNIEALKFILDNLAPHFPDVIFGIVGGVCYAIKDKKPSNVIYFGMVDEAKKQTILEIADIGLNPIVSGSGSNLKLAEYFSKKLAVITTPIGARGYDIKNRTQAIISNLQDFNYALRELVDNPHLRDYISRLGYQYAKENLDWGLQAKLFRYYLEYDIKFSREQELKKPKILIDISFLKEEDWNTGIHRVVKSQMKYLKAITKELFVYPVFLKDNKYYYASFKAYAIGIDDIVMPEYEVKFESGDILYMPDFTINTLTETYSTGIYHKLKERGVKIVSFVHDILPIKLPSYFPEDTHALYKNWIKAILDISDKIICNSKATAKDVEDYANKLNLIKRPDITYIHLGSDIKSTKHQEELSHEDSEFLNKIKENPYFLVVSTIEPRKGHRQVLKAFEKLWAKGYNFNLVFVGKKGWMMDDFMDYIEKHPEKNKRFFYLGYVSDDMLEHLYKNATATIMASEGEGFGLSIIESAYYKTPIIARDIPVFREVAQDGAYYFPNTKDENVLAEYILKWYELYKQDKHPKPDNIKAMSWEEHAQKLKDILLK